MIKKKLKLELHLSLKILKVNIFETAYIKHYVQLHTLRAPKTRFPVVVLKRPTSSRARKGLRLSAGSTE